MYKHGLIEIIYQRNPATLVKWQIFGIELTSILLRPRLKVLRRYGPLNYDMELLLVQSVMSAMRSSSLPTMT